TVTEGAKALAAEGASEVYAAATHAVLSGKAVQHLAESPIKEIIVTNTLPIPEENAQVLGERLKVVSIAPILASALLAVFEDESVCEIFKGENQPQAGPLESSVDSAVGWSSDRLGPRAELG